METQLHTHNSTPPLLHNSTPYTVKPLNKGCTGDDKFSCCVLCREVVLFSKVQNVMDLSTKDTFKGPKQMVNDIPVVFKSLPWRVHYQRFYCIPHTPT